MSDQHARHRQALRGLSRAALVALRGADGCSSADDELSRFIDDTKKEPGGRVEPLPEVKPYETFVYSAAEHALAVPAGQPGRRSGAPGVRPDSKRNREFLEQFSLDTLRMVGTLQLGGQNYGLVQTKDGLVHRVLPRQLPRPERRQDHRYLALEDQCDRNRSGRPRRVHGAPSRARPERIVASRSREF